MAFDFSVLLLFATVGSGLVVLIDTLYWRKVRRRQGLGGEADMPVVIEYARSFFQCC